MKLLYGDIGKKIKWAAFVSFIVEAIAAVIVGLTTPIILVTTVDDNILLFLLGLPLGVLVAVIGVFVAWVSSWLMYGFGELIDKTCDIEKNTRGGQSTTQIKETDEKTEREEDNEYLSSPSNEKKKSKENRIYKEVDEDKIYEEAMAAAMAVAKAQAAERAAAEKAEREADEAAEKAIKKAREEAEKAEWKAKEEAQREAQREAIKKAREEAIKNNEEGIATHIKINKEGMVECPICDNNFAAEPEMLLRCPKCNCIIRAKE